MTSESGTDGPSAPAPQPAETGEVDPSAHTDRSEPDRFERFAFKRELDQIYLLLDHISTSITKRLPAPTANSQDAADDIIEDIANISYPPEGSKASRADQAATLVRALDVLNRCAAPANSMTIAYTLLVAGEGTPHSQAWPAWPWEGHEPRARDELKGRAPTRYDLAVGAFPSLARRAFGFRRFSFLLICGLIIFFIFTCALSWNVATGNSLLGQLNTLKLTRGDIAKQIATAESGDSSRPTGTTSSSPQASIPAAASPSSPFVPYCERFQLGERSTKQVEQTDTATGIPLCDRRRMVEIQLLSAQQNLERWLNSGLVIKLMRQAAVGASPQAGVAPSCVKGIDQDPFTAPQCRDEVDAQWAATNVQILGGAVLPIFYGLLGAGAAVVRGISAKIKESVLAPRDLMLSIVQLVLGAVIGGCIGLFITPAGSGPQGQPGLLGSVQLSASALCFIAGFGVESVFGALETIIRRVFNAEDPTARKAAA